MNEVKYQGIFFEGDSITKLREMEGDRRLKKVIIYPHITFAYKPSTLLSRHLLGKEYEVKIIGYGNDGENSGFEVSLSEELMNLYDGAPVIHITTSVSKSGEEVNTGKLLFRPIESFTIRGKLGYFVGNRVTFIPMA